MARPKSLNPRARDAMRAAVASLWMKGLNDGQIGAELGISGEGARYWRLKLEREAQHAIADRAGLIASQAAALRHIRAEALTAWEKSKTVLDIPDKDDGPVRVAADGKATGGEIAGILVESPGNPQFLAQARAALADEAELLGLAAPLKVAPTDPTGERPYESLTDAQLDARLLEILAGAARRRMIGAGSE